MLVPPETLPLEPALLLPLPAEPPLAPAPPFSEDPPAEPLLAPPFSEEPPAEPLLPLLPPFSEEPPPTTEPSFSPDLLLGSFLPLVLPSEPVSVPALALEPLDSAEVKAVKKPFRLPLNRALKAVLRTEMIF